MTLASLVRKTLGLNNHRVVRVAHQDDRIVVWIERIRRRRLPCSVCGTFERTKDRLPERSWRHVPLWGIGVELRYRPWRVRCSCCQTPKVEKIPWAQGKSPISRPLIVVLATWSRLLPWDTVAQLFGVSWSTVVAAVDAAVEHGLSRRDLSRLRYIGVDEVSRRRRHIYHTNVYDLEAKKLIFSVQGRGEEALHAFFDAIGPVQAARIDGVCCDMWAPYAQVIRARAPQATLVFDKFHVVRYLLDAVNAVRKLEQRALRESAPDLLKGTRFIWLKNPANLTDRQRARLVELERVTGLKTLRAYLLKELFRHLWSYRSKAWARRFFQRWFWWATHSGLKPMRDVAWLLRRHEDGIFAYFDCRIDNGVSEALNNNAKAISHRARGFRTERAFTLAMYHCMGGLELPRTWHKFA